MTLLLLYEAIEGSTPSWPTVVSRIRCKLHINRLEVEGLGEIPRVLILIRKVVFMLFDFLNMPSYDQRKIGRHEEENLIVSTVTVTDSAAGHETAVSHPDYNNGSYIVVEEYYTREDATIGHEKWVKLMTSEDRPKELKDVSTCEIAKLFKAVSGK